MLNVGADLQVGPNTFAFVFDLQVGPNTFAFVLS
jgi:hypothetical protein